MCGEEGGGEGGKDGPELRAPGSTSVHEKEKGARAAGPPQPLHPPVCLPTQSHREGDEAGALSAWERANGLARAGAGPHSAAAAHASGQNPVCDGSSISGFSATSGCLTLASRRNPDVGERKATMPISLSPLRRDISI